VAEAQAAWSGDSSQDLAEALTRLRQSLPIKQPVIVGIPTSASVVTTVQPLIVNRHHERVAVEFELQQHLPYDVSEAIWHYHWFSPDGQRGVRKPSQIVSPDEAAAAVVAATKQVLLEERLTACRRAGIAIQQVGVAAVSAANAWWQQRSATDPPFSVLLHLDGALVEWIVVSPSGLHVFTTFQNQEATGQEQWLATLKSSWANLHELFGTRATEVQAPVMVFGGPGALNLLAQDLRREFGCHVGVLDPERIATLEPTSASNAQSLVIALGLALQGLGPVRLPMNLLVEKVRQRRASRMRRTAQVVCGCLAVLAVALSAAGMLSVLRHQEERLTQLAKQEQTYQALRPEARAQLKRQVRLEDRLNQLDALTRERSRLTQAFEGLVGILPDEVWLTTLELSKDLPQAAGSPQGGGTMDGMMEGYARSFQGLTVFMDRLKSLAGWPTVKPLGTTVTTDQATGKELVAFIVQTQQPLPAPSPTGQADPDATSR